MYSNNTIQGKYEVVNREKYLGDPDKVRYLSSYERATFRWCDLSPNVIRWSSEEVVVPYHDPIKQKNRRYIVDVYLEYKMPSTGEVRKILIEIKPSQFTKPPKKGRKRKDIYEAECATYITNQAKWGAAEKFAKQRGWEFQLLTENEIFK